MKVTEHTKISSLIKENADVIDVIASINKHFEKLRNPILRKFLAPRVTIKDAARIGGTSVQEFFRKLKPLGFYCDFENYQDGMKVSDVPDFYKNMVKRKILELDVRPDLESGKDPFNRVMDVLAQMPEEYVLKLINTFEPIPLLNLLVKKGYSYYVVTQGPELAVTYIKYTGQKKSEEAEQNISYMEDLEQMQKIIAGQKEKVKEIDVRMMEAPLPMVTILNELESLPKGFLLYVHHKKVPQLLLPELAQRNFFCKIWEGKGEANVKLLIYE